MGAIGVPLEVEERRRRRMSLALLAGVLVAALAINNERALFNIDLFDEVAAAATIKALAAAPPTPWQALGVPRIYPIHRAGQALAPPPPPPAAFAARIPQAPTDQVSPLATPDVLGPPSIPDPPLPPFAGPPPAGPIGPIVPPSESSSGGASSSGGSSGGDVPPPVSAVPEPSVWAMLILGFGCVGGMLRLAGRRLARVERRTA